MNFAAGRCRRLSEFRADIDQACRGCAGLFRDRQRHCWRCCEISRRLHRAGTNHSCRRHLCGTCRSARRLSHRKGLAMKLHFITIQPLILPIDFIPEEPTTFHAGWRHFAGAHRRLALVRSATTARNRCATRRADMEAESVLSRAGSSPVTPVLAKPVPASINLPTRSSKTSRSGAACALMKKASIGRRSRRWHDITAANTT